MNRTRRRTVLTAGVAAVLLGVAACHSVNRVAKTGAQRHTVTVITLQLPDGSDPDGRYFAADVDRLSGRSLKVRIDSATYNSAQPDSDARLVAAMRSGQASFSYQAARGWAAAGVASFQALDDPFLLTTVQASEALARSPVAAKILRQLSTVGMVGIGLIPTEPRQILSTAPILTTTSLTSARLRINDNPETSALLHAIGARPVEGLTAEQTQNGLEAGSIDGVETSPSYILNNSYNADASYLTSWALIPKFETIAATTKAWAVLTPGQRTAMTTASADTLTHAGQVPTREDHQLDELCATGVVIDQPPITQLDAIAAEAAGATSTSPDVTAMITAIRNAVAGTGPQTDALTPPAGCRVAHSASQARSLHRVAVTPTSPAPRTGATIPPGTYVTTDTPADFAAGGQTGPDWNKPIRFTWHLYANGKVFESQDPEFPDNGNTSGHYIVKGEEVTFVWDAYTDLTPETLRWSYYDAQLSFTIVSVQDTAGRVIYTAHPWRKVS